MNPVVYIHDNVKMVHEIHNVLLTKRDQAISAKDYLEQYARNLSKAFSNQSMAVYTDISNYYKPLMGKSIKEVFSEDLNGKDFKNIAAAVHGFAEYDFVPDCQVDMEFESALDYLLEGSYYELERMLIQNPELVKKHSHFGHKAQLIHYGASNAVEIYRQVVPSNLAKMIELLMMYGADPNVKIPVYGGHFDFFELFYTSAHPVAAKVVSDIRKLFD